MSTIKIRIPNRSNASVVCWEGEIEDTGSTARNLGNAVLEALKQGANMSGANMSGADMSRANMSGANMSGANMSGANMSGADMSRANMSGANMSGADMSRANMSGADMSRANMSRANMSGANMSGANMSGANMSGADMSGANMSGANMSGADMSGANMSRADMSGANMSGANMSGANMSGADMSGADMSRAMGAELPIARSRILPEGSLIGWKQLRSGIIAKLRIPEGAKRSHAFGRKCRAEFAEVLELWTPGGTPAPLGVSQHDVSFRYEVGKIVRPSTPFSENWEEECAPGIHFFITRLEAENYQ